MQSKPVQRKREPLGGAYFWLVVFYLIYCARPEDWIPGLHVVPLAKVSGVLAVLALALSLGRSKRGVRDLPWETLFIVLLLGVLMISAVFSPVWQGGAVTHTLDFSKEFLVFLVTLLAVTTLPRLRRLLLIQTGSVALIATVSVVKGRSAPRLEGVLSGIYSNPNDLAFAIALTIPLGFAFLLRARGVARRLAWGAAMLVMATAVFYTASRAGFIAMTVAGVVCLWHFGVKGRRPVLILATGLAAAALIVFAGGTLKSRFMAISGEDLSTDVQASAYSSFQARNLLIEKSFDTILKFPLLGIGLNNFQVYSGTWREVHDVYLQVGSEGGIPALILYLLIFWRAFVNLRRLRRIPDLDEETRLYAGALHSVLVAFAVGALFAPEAFQYFQFFAVSYCWVLFAITVEQRRAEAPLATLPSLSIRRAQIYAETSRTKPVTLAR